MDPSLRRQREEFQRRSRALPVVEKKTSKPSGPAAKPRPKKKKRSEKLSRPKPQPLTGSGVKQSTHLSSNPYRILKAVVDMMKQRYTSRNYDPLNLEEILEAIDLTDLKTDTREWVLQALKGNVKIKYYPEGERFLFQPAIGLDVRNRRQLLAKLAEYEREGLGGIPLSEVKEALHKPDKAVQRLKDEGDIVVITRLDKEEILFYKNREYEIDVDEKFRSLWRGVSVDGLGEGDIERYLQNVGLGAMQGQARKRKTPSSQQKARKKSRMQKVLNTHLETGLLKDYSEGAAASGHSK